MDKFVTSDPYKATIEKLVAELTKGRSKAEKHALQKRLAGEVRLMLGEKEGWDKAAVLAYLELIRTNALNDAKKQHKPLDKVIKTYWQRLHQVGTAGYTKVFKASKLKVGAKLDLMIVTHLGGQIDENVFFSWITRDRQSIV